MANTTGLRVHPLRGFCIGRLGFVGIVERARAVRRTSPAARQCNCRVRGHEVQLRDSEGGGSLDTSCSVCHNSRSIETKTCDSGDRGDFKTSIH